MGEIRRKKLISSQKRPFLVNIVVFEMHDFEQLRYFQVIFNKNDYSHFCVKTRHLEIHSSKTSDFSLKQEKRVFAGIYHDRLCVYTSFTRNIYGV